MTDEPQHTYRAGYSSKETTVKAASLYAAKLAAIAHFKPRKSQEHMVWVVLSEKADGEKVSLFNSNADLG